MPTERQLAKRKSYLGSSDMAAVLGRDPWRGPYDVWLEKTSRVPDDYRGEVEHLRAGQLLERALLVFAKDELGPIRSNQFRRGPGRLAAHVDAIVQQDGTPIEAKSQGIWSDEEFGRPGSDVVPPRVIIQCHVHMICTDQRACHVVHYHPRSAFSLYAVPISDNLAKAIIERASAFWVNVVSDDPPDDSIPSLDLARAMHRVQGHETKIPDDIIARYEQTRDDAKEAAMARDTAQAAVLAALGDGDRFITPGGRTGTYSSSEFRNIDTTRLRADHPTIASEYVKISERRTLRLKKNGA